MPQGSSNNQSDPSVDHYAGSVLASLQETASNQRKAWSLTSDTHFRVATGVCSLVLLIALALRLLYLRKRSDNAVLYQRLDATRAHDRARKYVIRRHLPYSLEEDYENTFVGLSIPLLQEVTTI